MKPDHLFEERRPRAWVILDLESAVLDEAGHRRYQAMERWTPNPDQRPSRRHYERREDPLQTPRWVFQTITTAAIMVLVEHAEGNVDVSRFVTLSAPEHDEREVVAGLFQVLADAPTGAELVSWAGGFHDLPLLTCAAMKHGLTLPLDWRWIAFGGDGRQRHLDHARLLTGGLKMKPIHQAEYAAALDIPAKMTAKPSQAAHFINTGRWDLVQEICEGDVITAALLLARWRKLHDPRANIATVEDRILRRVEQLRAGRGYVAELSARRTARFGQQLKQAQNDADVLAPWWFDRAA